VASGRRLAVLVVALALVGAPAVALRALCVGKSCAQEGIAGAAPIPFCPLPAALREQIVAGYRQGRSPDVMGTTNVPMVGWPWVGYTSDQNAAPIMFFGKGIFGGRLPNDVGLDQIAPTIAELMDFRRAHPEVRSGAPISDVVHNGPPPPLVVEIVWTGVGTASFNPAGTPWLTDHDLHGAWTYNATTGSLPTDPAAVLTTIGTGGLPSQHGITGTFIRGKDGAPARAWGLDAPTSIIATLGDDWDHATAQSARIGLVAPTSSDRGLIGGTWYLDVDRDDVLLGASDVVDAVGQLLAAGYGADTTTDILGVALGGGAQGMDKHTGQIVEMVRRLVPDAVFVLTATGAQTGGSGPSIADGVDAAVGAPVVAAVSGGLFLNQQVMATTGITSDEVVLAMDSLDAPNGDPLFADAYPGFAVSFSRYC